MRWSICATQLELGAAWASGRWMHWARAGGAGSVITIEIMAIKAYTLADFKKEWVEASLLHRIWMVLACYPAVCALFAPSLPWFETMSRKAAPLLDLIELGRGRPWVVFTGMPCPATLRLFGDVCGINAVLVLLLSLLNPLEALFPGHKLNEFKEKIIKYYSYIWLHVFFVVTPEYILSYIILFGQDLSRLFGQEDWL
ncbi:MAG: hypothetical protein LBH10_02340 [Burkholderiaceae bacterium]|nr:hypothetical protein [Burkholderiaceae bacterium]